MERQDLVVIGGGTSGYIVATGALRFGLKVILIEKSTFLGGSALHHGCIPSKTMLHVANTANLVQNAKIYGLDSYLLPPDIAKINTHISGVVAGLEKQEDHEAQYIFNQLGGEIIFGAAKFIDAHRVQVGSRIIKAKKFVLATGSSPILPAIRGLDQIGYLTNDLIFKLQHIPEKLVILGGKPSAIEFAQAFARLGSKVAIIARGDSILPQEDPELVNKLKDLLIQEGIEFYLNTTVIQAYMQRSKKVLECVHDSGESFAISGDEVLVAVGRSPNVSGLGLENAGVAYAPDGIVVDKKLRTSIKHICAVGDVIRSQYKFTHAAEYQANIVLSNIVFRYPAKVKYFGFPYAIFTSPEYAHVGLHEIQAKKQGLHNIEVTRFEFKDLDSAAIQNTRTGMIKVVTRRGKIIGATILGPQASNLIAEWGLAINMGARIGDVAATIHAYPTLAQISRRVANKQTAKGMFSVYNRRWVMCLQKMFAWA